MALQLRAKRSMKPNIKVGALLVALGLALQPVSVGPVAQALADAVSINEVMPNPVTISDAAGEWIELKNNGSSIVDISGWTVASGTIPASASIESGGFYVLCKTNEATTECDAISASLSLTNASQTVTLKSASDEVIDTFTYDSVVEGESIEVIRENGTSTGSLNSSDPYSTNQAVQNTDNTGTPGTTNRAQAVATEVTNVRTGMQYDDLQLAVNDALTGDTLQLNEDISTSSQVTITKALTIDGGGFEIDAAFFKTDNGNNSALGVQADDVTVRNVSLTSSADDGWPKQLHGINVFESLNVIVSGVTVYGFEGTGIAYNASTGTIENVHTANNGWHGINVDKAGANVTVQGANTHNEPFADIYVDNDTVGQVTAPEYTWDRSNRPELGYENDRVYRLKNIEACNASTFDSFGNGSVNGQFGWKATNSNIDQAIVDNIYGYETFGCKTLRMSNSYASGSFGDQTFSAPALVKAGENDENDRYEASFSFGSAKQSAQPGLSLSVSPDDGVGNRMSYVGLTDTASGTSLTFYDTNSDGVFEAEPLGVYSRTEPVTIKFEIEFNDGPSNDVVDVYVNGELEHTGTTWEDYYRNSPEQAGNGNVVPGVDRLLIRAAGTPAPATAGNGFVFDNVAIATSKIDADGPIVSKLLVNGKTISGTYQSNANCKTAAQLYALNGSINLTAVIDDDSNVASASYKVRKLNDGGCTLSNVYSSGAVALKQSTKNVSNWNQQTAFDTASEGLYGAYAIQLTTKDALGNQTVRYIHLNIDNVAPEVRVNMNRESYPASGSIVSQNDRPEIEARDDNLDRIEVYRGDTKITTWHATSSTRFAGIGWMADGTYTIRAYDKSGLVSEDFIITLDKTDPILDVTSPEADDEYQSGQEITVTGSVSDNTDISRVVMFVDASNNGTRQVEHEFDDRTGGTFTFTIPAGSLSAGEHRLVVNAYDEASNHTTVRVDFEIKPVPIGIPGNVDGDDEETDNEPQEQPTVVLPAPAPSSNSNSANGNPLTTVPATIQQPSFTPAFIGNPNGATPQPEATEQSDDGDILGTTATENDDNGEVAGANDKAGWSIGDMAWYWWVVVVLGAMGLWLMIAAGIRRLRGSEV